MIVGYVFLVRAARRAESTYRPTSLAPQGLAVHPLMEAILKPLTDYSTEKDVVANIHSTHESVMAVLDNDGEHQPRSAKKEGVQIERVGTPAAVAPMQAWSTTSRFGRQPHTATDTEDKDFRAATHGMDLEWDCGDLPHKPTSFPTAWEEDDVDDDAWRCDDADA